MRRDPLKGTYFALLHAALAATLVIVLFFSTSLVTLAIGAVFLLADMAGILLFRGCPLTFLEQYHLGFSSSLLVNGVTDPDWRSTHSHPCFTAEIEHVLQLLVLYFLKMTMLSFLGEKTSLR